MTPVHRKGFAAGCARRRVGQDSNPGLFLRAEPGSDRGPGLLLCPGGSRAGRAARQGLGWDGSPGTEDSGHLSLGGGRPVPWGPPGRRPWSRGVASLGLRGRNGGWDPVGRLRWGDLSSWLARGHQDQRAASCVTLGLPIACGHRRPAFRTPASLHKLLRSSAPRTRLHHRVPSPASSLLC